MATIEEANKLNLEQWCFETDNLEYFTKAQDAVRDFLPYAIPGTVVDLGCGDGAAEKPILEAGFKYLGVDINPKKLARIKSETVEQEMYAWLKVQPSASVDNIFSHHSLEHTANPFEIVAEIGRVLKGTGFIEVPSVEPEGCHISTIHELAELLPEGFLIVDSRDATKDGIQELRVLFTKEVNHGPKA